MMDVQEAALLRASLDEIAIRADGSDLTSALDAFGWLELLDSEPRAAVTAVFGAQGTSGTWSAALQDVLAIGVSRLDDESSTTSAAVVLPVPQALTAGIATRVEGLVVGPRTGISCYIVPDTDHDGRLTISRVPCEALTTIPTSGLDGRLQLAKVSGEVKGGKVLAAGREARAWWSATETAGRRAICHQLSSTAAHMLELAVEHARQRRQFGVPIGSFQAVRHKLAETYVAVTAASAAADACWEVADPREAWLAALTAKIVASQSVGLTISHTQQVLAGMGFTAEHPFHRFMKRALVLDRVLGSAIELAPIVGRELVRLGAAPRLVEL
jgi:hypothetical protein